jgi:hypothetical protein
LCIALIGNRTNWLRGVDYPADWEISYGDRPKVEIEAGERERFGDVLARAAKALRVSPAPVRGGPYPWEDPPFIGFYRGDDERDFGGLEREITLLDEDGRVRWTWDWINEPVGEILRAGDAGLIVGDARRPYLILQPGIGNGVPVDWPTFLELWRLWWDIADKVVITAALIEGTRRALTKVRRDPHQLPDIVESRYAQWQTNGGRPDNLASLLGQRPWHAADLAERLGCTIEEAEALLIGFGHERSTSGLWTPGESQEAQLLRDNIAFIVHAGMTTRVDAVEDVLRARAEALANDGMAPRLDWADFADLPQDTSRLPHYEPPPDESLQEDLEVVSRYRLSSVLHRLRRIRRNG